MNAIKLGVVYWLLLVGAMLQVDELRAQDIAEEATAEEVALAEGSQGERSKATPEVLPENEDAKQPSTVQQLEKRVAELEAKQELLLTLLFKTVKLEQQEAKRRYAEAQFEYRNSERLQLQGVLSAYQLDLDRFAMEKARLEFLLAESNQNTNALAAEIDWIESKSRLRIAERQFQDSQLKLARGYMDERAFKRFQQALEDRKKEVELQEERLRATRELTQQSSAAVDDNE